MYFVASKDCTVCACRCVPAAVCLQPTLGTIPQFYFPGGAAPVSDDVKQLFSARVNALFDPHPQGLNLEQFSSVVQEVRTCMLLRCWMEQAPGVHPCGAKYISSSHSEMVALLHKMCSCRFARVPTCCSAFLQHCMLCRSHGR